MLHYVLPTFKRMDVYTYLTVLKPNHKNERNHKYLSIVIDNYEIDVK